jgi:glutaminyl-tRNA synthetase
MSETERPAPKRDFIRERVAADVAAGKNDGRVVTRFPPEPNGYLHVGHAKAICIDFGIAEEFGGRCHLRFDDTNPEGEDERFVEGIREDLRWLGFDWGEHLYFASDYYERLWDCAVELVRRGQAYVDDQNEEEIRRARGTVTEPGTPSPWRGRSAEESLDLLERMRAGEFEEGACVLRAKIDMASPNMKMRDPLVYRIKKQSHYRRGDAWCVYPMYDFAHCLSDAFEGVTHSLCSLEFENNRELYDWFLETLETENRPVQIEFARMNLTHAVMSKRRLALLVGEGHVDGWDDPRMPTLAGMRRRGYPPEAIRSFVESLGVARRDDSVASMAQLEYHVREVLNREAQRVMAVLDPLKVVIETFPEGRTEQVEAVNNPEKEADGTRTVPFTRTIWIERGDFLEEPPRKFFRLAPGREVRLKHAYFVTCTEVVKDEEGRVVELRCTHDPATAGGSSPDGRSPKGTIHWVSAEHAVEAEVRLYDTLFRVETPGRTKADTDFIKELNPDSLQVLRGCKLEPGLAEAEPGRPWQFLRQGYFTRDSRAEGLVFNRTVGLRDTWAKLQAQRG